MTEPSPVVVNNIVAFLRAVKRTPSDYEPVQLAAILYHDFAEVERAVWVLKHRRLDRPAHWPVEWLV